MSSTSPKAVLLNELCRVNGDIVTMLHATGPDVRLQDCEAYQALKRRRNQIKERLQDYEDGPETKTG